MISKVELRRSLLKKRQSLPPEVWREKSKLLCNHLQSSTIFNQAQTVLAYFSFKQEPDLSTLFFTESKRQWVLPRCAGNSLSWHIWKPGEALQKSNYGIFEPAPTAPSIQSTEADLMLVPAVACDRRGYRLGYGGGFYDRLLSLSEWNSIPTIGIVLEQAFLPQLPIDDWDKPLQGVCTELELKILPTQT
ncbi:MAG: 5-formyltetrahydrofolate cyclo-ligase [Coleofasciculaceae cyanobacterium]